MDVFFRRVDALGDRPFLHAWRDQRWQPWSWREVAQRVTALGASLRRLGLQPGDRAILVAENRVEWHASALAILSVRAINVPLSTAASADEWAEIIANAEPSLCIASSACAAKLAAVLERLGRPLPTVVIGETPTASAHAWTELAAGEAPRPDCGNALDDVCCLIYTSGTGGKPKGVEQTHRAILWNAIGAAQNLAAYGLDHIRFLSFLPLSHAYEHTGGFLTPIAMGAEVYVSRGVEHLAAELISARPTVLVVVPRFCEVMQQRIATALERQPAWRQWLFATTARFGRRAFLGERVGLVGRLWLRGPGRKVQAQLRARFGGALTCMLAAGAPLRPETCIFFNALGLPVHQAFGQTEAAPGITMQRRGALRPGGVGVAMAGMTVRLAEDGEILARGPNVMRGYWREPELTARTLAGGWLHTGDIGRIEADGSLAIVDRKKDFLKTAGGDMIAPQPIELALAAQPGVGQMLVCGDGWPHLAALFVPDQPTRDRLQAGTVTLDDVTRGCQRAVDAVNRAAPAKQRIRRFAIIAEPFTIENGLLTNTMKIRRRAVLEKHAALVRTLEAPR